MNQSQQNKTLAVIEIGSTGIRLLVAEIIHGELPSQNKRNILDRSEVPVSIGRDVFTTGAIGRDTLVQCIQILNRFKEQLTGWGIEASQTTVIGTSAVREASNRDPFVDRIKIKTGFTVKVIDGIEENRLMYIAVTECLKDESYIARQSDTIILDITGASTEMMLMEKGRIVGAHSMRLGTVIIEQQIRSLLGSIEDTYRFIEEFIQNTRATWNTEMSLHKIKQFIAIGNDMKLCALFAGKPVSPFLWEVQRDEFERFSQEVQQYTIDECMARFKLNYSDAQTFQISLLAYSQFVKLTNVKSIIIPETSLREGVIYSQMDQTNQELQQEFNEQIVASATTLLKKYLGDEKHAEYVKSMSLRLFDSLEAETHMAGHDRLLLEVSAILHDIGMFIRASDHNLHSQYIIQHSEIFGLSREDVNLIAMISKFHKGTLAPQDDPEVKMLSRSRRLTIMKLSAILRLADALDRSHQQKVANFTIDLAQDTLTFRVKGHNNLGLEKLAVKEKGDLFENVFGYKIVLL